MDFDTRARRQPLLLEAKRKYPTVKSITDGLRMLGRPPSDPGLNEKIAVQKIDTFLRIITCLDGSISTIQAYWSSSLYPWITYILHLFLSPDDATSTNPETFDHFERAILLVPFLISPTDKRKGSSHVNFLRRNSPGLHSLLLQVWLRTLDREHYTRGSWSHILAMFTYHPGPIKMVIDKSAPRPYKEEEGNLPFLCTHHLNLAIHKFRQSGYKPEHLNHIEELMTCMGGECFTDGHTFEHRRIRHLSIPMLVRLARMAGYRWINRRPASSISDSDIDHSIAVIGICWSMVLYTMSESQWVLQALEAGVIKAILRVHPPLLEAAPYDSKKETFETLSVSILETISQFLVLLPVLHQFLKALHEIERSGKVDDEAIRGKSKRIWDTWRILKEKALALRDFRKDYQGTSPGACDYSECPTDERKRFLKCSKCSSSIYCSTSCAKLDWKAGSHRQKCPVLLRAKEYSKGPQIPTPYEWRFFKEWKSTIIIANEKVIGSKLAEYFQLAQNSKGRHADANLILHGIRLPMIMVDLDQPGLPSISDIRACDPTTLEIVSRRRVREADIKEYATRWRESSTTKQIYFVGLFPRAERDPWPMVTVIDYPFEDVPLEKKKMVTERYQFQHMIL